VNENPQHIINVLSRLIAQGKVKFPLVSDFMVLPASLIDNQSTDIITEMPYIDTLPEFLATETRMFDGKEIVLLFREKYYY
jgi:hypothetical protein